MPEIPIHEEVGYKIAKKNKLLDVKDFYLGVLTPDAVNLEGFASKEERWYAHLRDKNLNEWRNNLYNFFINEKKNYPKEFLLGYVTHILTDIIFDEKFYLEVRQNMLNDNIPLEQTHLLMRDEMNNYSSNSIYYYEVLKKLNNINEFYDIRNIKSNNLKEWYNKIISKLMRNKESIYITEKVINNLTDNVEKELDKYLKEI